MTAILGLIDEAAAWLRSKNTDQWARPWPSRAGRDSRVREGIGEGKTWICWDHDRPAATITTDPVHDPYWEQPPESDLAVYVHRLVVARQYAGFRLGGSLLDWAGWTARRLYGARWVRISAWTTNKGLHAYYVGQGFTPSGRHPDDGYPSAARFQKPTGSITVSWARLIAAPDRLTELRGWSRCRGPCPRRRTPRPGRRPRRGPAPAG
jgi:GNAT superfamily N-acetyltransferase